MAFWQCLLIVSVLSYTAVLCQKKAVDNRTCVPGEVSCDGGSTCLPSRWVCDGEEDCADGSDEHNCTSYNRTCGPGDVSCDDNSMCFSSRWLCDGDRDCADGSDEHNCTNNVGQRTCGPGDVLCDVSSMCFPSRWLCDGDRDCADGSDEHNCTSRAATCPSDTFYCGDDSIACIPLAWRCDGTPECPSGVDEQNCTRKVMCDSTQFRCDDQSCVDSTQRCDGAKDCFNGRDEQNCIHHNVPVILAERHNIHMVTLYLDTSKAVSRRIFPENRNSSIVGIDYDYVEGYVFWTDSERNAIYSARFLNSSSSLTDVRAILTTDIRRSDGLAVDWINKLVYWTDTGRDEISVSNYNGTQRKVLVNTDLDEPRAIVVDPLLGWMYWTDWGIRAKIERAGMDGTRRETIVTTDLTWPNGLTLDYKDRRLYWVDSKSKTVESARKDGSDRKVLNKGDVNHGFGITSSELYVFITSWMDRGVVKVSKADGVATLFTGEPEDAIRYPMGLKVYSDTVQKPRPSVCNSNKFQCEYLCLPGPSQSQDSAAEYTCACPDGDTCGDTTTTDASTTNRQTTITPRTTPMPPTVSTTTVPSSTDLVRTEISTAERTTTVAPPQTTQVTNQVTLSGCVVDEIACDNTSLCIPQSWKCYGQAEWPSGSNEENLFSTLHNLYNKVGAIVGHPRLNTFGMPCLMEYYSNSRRN